MLFASLTLIHGVESMPQAYTPAIISFMGTELSKPFSQILQEHKPFGAIIMGRNIDKNDAGIQDKQKLSHLCKTLKTFVHSIFIDQEGGAVRRLRDPVFHQTKDMKYFGTLYDQDPQKAKEELIEQTEKVAQDLNDCHINANCAPCLDLDYDQPVEENHVISFYKRAFHRNPQVVSELGSLVCETFLKQGITPVMKHLPGHGQSAGSDPHNGICHVKNCLDDDIKPFKAQINNTKIWGMTNHVIYDQYDRINPVATSPTMVNFIRETIGFKGLLITDAIEMGALDHMQVTEKVNNALNAGHDAVLYCGGDISICTTILKEASKHKKIIL